MASNPCKTSALDAFERQYIETALWSSTGDDGRQLSETVSVDDLPAGTIATLREHCASFRSDPVVAEILTRYDDSDLGHDLWLTRNHHGAGYWDGDYAEADGEALTKAAHALGDVDLYIGDDGKVYVA